MQRAFAALITATLLAQPAQAQEADSGAGDPYIGLWVTADGYIRHELLPNGLCVPKTLSELMT